MRITLESPSAATPSVGRPALVAAFNAVAALLRELRRSRPAEALLVAGVALMALAAALAWS